MTRRTWPYLLAAILAFVLAGDLGLRILQTHRQVPAAMPPATLPTRPMSHTSGTFEVQMEPQGDASQPASRTVGRMTISKQFHGGITGTSQGEMLTAMTEVKGSAGYVAIERVTGTLEGHAGDFALQHTGTMDRGQPALNITVVPDSGTGALVGLTGRLTIKIADGQHSYDFEYTLPAQP